MKGTAGTPEANNQNGPTSLPADRYFSLTELVIVVAVIVLLGAVLIPQLLVARQRAVESATVGIAGQILAAGTPIERALLLEAWAGVERVAAAAQLEQAEERRRLAREFASTDAALASHPPGLLTIEIPTALENGIGRTAEVRLEPHSIAAQVQDYIAATGDVSLVDVRFSEIVTASLQGDHDDLSITQVGPATQRISLSDATVWRWRMMGRRPGTYSATLVLETLVGGDTFRPIHLETVFVRVHSTFIESVAAGLRSFMLWVFPPGVVVTLLIALFVKARPHGSSASKRPPPSSAA
jgi:hypothetical protein